VEAAAPLCGERERLRRFAGLTVRGFGDGSTQLAIAVDSPVRVEPFGLTLAVDSYIHLQAERGVAIRLQLDGRCRDLRRLWGVQAPVRQPQPHVQSRSPLTCVPELDLLREVGVQILLHRLPGRPVIEGPGASGFEGHTGTEVDVGSQ